LETNPEVLHQIEEEIMERFHLKGRAREEEIKSGAE
jgi:hypothetical protein